VMRERFTCCRPDDAALILVDGHDPVQATLKRRRSTQMAVYGRKNRQWLLD
jgi:hypothetical protein